MSDLTPEQELGEYLGSFYDDPEGFSLACWKWGEGALSEYTGPLDWQREVLREIGSQVKQRNFDGKHAVEPIRIAISSGHGVAKTTLSAIIASWLISTRPKSKGKVTAQTWTQLESVTWASLKFWLGECISAPLFEIGAHRIRAHSMPDAWFCTAESPKAENSQAFAGQHASDSTSWILADEASDLPQEIYSVARGAQTDGEPFFIMMGNCVRNSGVFHEAVFGERGADNWITRVIDSRDVEITNKKLLQSWVDEHGEDSDFCRVRIRGLPPRASSIQFIPSDAAQGAQSRSPICLSDDALIAGCDVSRGGEANTVIRFRRGLDASSIPPIKLSAEITRDSARVIQVIADLFSKDFGNGLKMAHLFMDSTGLGGPMLDWLKNLGHTRVTGVNFGSTPPSDGYANMRSYMWDRMKSWLNNGSVEKDADLYKDLIGPGYSYNAQSRLVLESKESMERRGVPSPDDGDALALTFAANVATRRVATAGDAKYARLIAMRNRCSEPWMG